MAIDWPILSVITFLPTLGALLILLVRGDEAARYISLAVTLLTFVLSLALWWAFDGSTAAFQFVESYQWIGDGIGYRMGVDGISMLFVVLTGLLMPICILASWKSITVRVREYMIAFLVLETLMMGVFCALDLVLF